MCCRSCGRSASCIAFVMSGSRLGCFIGVTCGCIPVGAWRDCDEAEAVATVDEVVVCLTRRKSSIRRRQSSAHVTSYRRTLYYSSAAAAYLRWKLAAFLRALQFLRNAIFSLSLRLRRGVWQRTKFGRCTVSSCCLRVG